MIQRREGSKIGRLKGREFFVGEDIAVGSSFGAVSGVKRGVDPIETADGDVRSAVVLQIALKLSYIAPVMGNIEVDNLGGGVNTSVGSSASNYVTLDTESTKRLYNGAHNGIGGMFLRLKPLKAAAVIGDNPFDAHLISP